MLPTTRPPSTYWSSSTTERKGPPTARQRSEHREAAGDREGLAGDELGLVGRQEHHGAGHVLRPAEAAPRDRLLQGVGEGGAARGELALEQRRLRRPGADAVDVDPVARHLAGQR